MSLANHTPAAAQPCRVAARPLAPGTAADAALDSTGICAPASVPAIRRGECAIDLDLRHAGRRQVTLRFECVGDPALPVVLVAGGISAGRHTTDSDAESGWWSAHVGQGRALDPCQHRLLSMDWLGADGALDVALDPADQADAIAALLDALQIDRLAAFVGCSYGAMVGLQFAAIHGARLEQLVAISGTHRAHPYASAWRALQRRAVALGALQCDETHGLALARQLAILSYRTPAEFDARFGAAQVRDGRVRVAAEDYLDHCAGKFTARTSPIAFQRLSESIDLQQLEPDTIDVPVTLVAVAEDQLVPVSDARALLQRLRAGACPRPRLCVLSSRYGHDAFLKETSQIDQVLRAALCPALAASDAPAVIGASA